MKKRSNALVTYDSSSDDAENIDQEKPKLKKRKLPSLSSALVEPIPVDRPELHQGRMRTQPHVEGQWAAHVYVSLLAQRHSPLTALIDEALGHAKKSTPTLNDFRDGEISKKRELHISLSRPIYLRSHQREDLKKAVKDLSKKFSAFKVSFATFSELFNDERTRTFLTIEVGAGHHELRVMSDDLTPTLRTIRQKEFYSDPRFHASIAWALLENQKSRGTADNHSITAGVTTNFEQTTAGSLDKAAFLTIPHFPKDLISGLNDQFSERLSAIKTGTCDVETVTVKIGKEVFTWPLSGSRSHGAN